MSQSDFVTRGQALVNSGQHQEAVKVCRLGLLGRPTTVEGRIVLGQALLALKRYDEVLAEMRVALELDHASIGAQVLKAEALLSKGDTHAAIEVLDKVRVLAPTDQKIESLLGIAKRSMGKPPLTASHPSVGFVGGETSDNTRNYPNHPQHDDHEGEETTGGSFAQATAVSSPAGSKKRSGAKPAVLPDPTPPPNVLAVGDRSGTVEVDPEADGIELDGEDDFGDVAAPPGRGRAPASIDNQRGQLFSMGGASAPRRAGGLPTPGLERHSRRQHRGDVSSVELIDDDLLEIDSGETLLPVDRRQPGPGTRVRNAVNVPSGPLDGARPVASRSTAHEQAPAPPAHLAQMIAAAPHVMEVARPQPSATMRGNPGGVPIAAALPTMAAVQPPAPIQPAPMAATALGMPVIPPSGAPNPNAVRPTLAIQADPNMAPPNAPAWARATVAANHQIHQNMPGSLLPGQARPEEPTSRPPPMDPKIAAMFTEGSNASGIAVIEPSASGVRALKTGMRKGRSKLQIAIWLVIGALVIAGGVFVGFKFRAMRLEKKIADTRDIALGLAKADTWKGLVRARDRLAGIAQASPTPDNKAALARTRAQIAFEFGDGLAEAKVAVDGLSGESGIDVEIAATYLALAQYDVKAALNAADRATKLGIDDPAVPYVTGQAHLLAGDANAALEHLKKAVDKEARPLHLLALARAYGENTQWAQALQTIDPAKVKAWFDAFDPDTARELGTSGIDVAQLAADHPNIAIERAQITAVSGKAVAKAQELRGALEKVVQEGAKAISDQVRGVSPTQVAFAHLALSVLEFTLGGKKSQAHLNAALAVGLDDQRFAEQLTETAYLTTDFVRAEKAAEIGLKSFPNSRRVRISLAKVLLAQGKPTEAQTIISKLPDADKQARSLAVRGQTKLALGDLAGAKDDFDRAYVQSGKNLEDALVGRTWVDLGLGEVEAARKRLGERFKSWPSAAVAIAWAAILTASTSIEDKKTAKSELERVVNGPVTLVTWRAHLQLARTARDIGDDGANMAYRRAYELTGNVDIRIETATYLIDFRKPAEGLEMLEDVLETASPPSAELLLEAARANMLVGKHARGAELLVRADKLPDVTRWKYERERGRLALRKAAFNDATIAFESALEKCGDDVETFYMAAEVAVASDKNPNTKLVEKIKKLATQRLKGPELKVVEAKLLSSKDEAASKLYEEARVAIGDTAAPRRRAQVALGRAIVAYNNEDDPTALAALDLAFTLDPTLYEAYLYYADIQKSKDNPRERVANLKIALEKAQKAIEFNPDNVDAYVMVGTVAQKLGNRKLFNDMLTKVNALAPNSEQLKQLQQAR